MHLDNSYHDLTGILYYGLLCVTVHGHFSYMELFLFCSKTQMGAGIWHGS